MPIFILKIDPEDSTCCYIGPFPDKQTAVKHTELPNNLAFYSRVKRYGDKVKTWHLIESDKNALCAKLMHPSDVPIIKHKQDVVKEKKSVIIPTVTSKKATEVPFVPMKGEDFVFSLAGTRGSITDLPISSGRVDMFKSIVEQAMTSLLRTTPVDNLYTEILSTVPNTVVGFERPSQIIRTTLEAVHFYKNQSENFEISFNTARMYGNYESETSGLLTPVGCLAFFVTKMNPTRKEFEGQVPLDMVTRFKFVDQLRRLNFGPVQDHIVLTFDLPDFPDLTDLDYQGWSPYDPEYDEWMTALANAFEKVEPVTISASV